MKLFQLKLCPKLWTDCTDPNIFQTRACYSNGQSCHIPPIFEPKKKMVLQVQLYVLSFWISSGSIFFMQMPVIETSQVPKL